MIPDRANDTLAGMKILPGLITLSSDSETAVRVSSVAGLGNVVNSSKSSDEVREKAAFQLLSFLDVSSGPQQRHLDHDIRVEVVRQLGLLVPAIRASDPLAVKLRDEVLLPKLADVCFKYSSIHSEERWVTGQCLENSSKSQCRLVLLSH